MTNIERTATDSEANRRPVGRLVDLDLGLGIVGRHLMLWTAYISVCRQGFPYIFGIVTGEVSVAAVGTPENKCLATHLLTAISTIPNGKIRSHPRFHAQQVR